ncbi:hypothetical protein D9758_012961 [Tetrapyrgos nigripes]|uniref:Uncharacterized protein n=1 Tax=Tetrapyrgos nigripes TaxID=182062 RepID=A0A8H5CKU5_9AGAR|nr:hypothetical protein D9758_012961 [Tetrapyrgos nigripes]
MYYDPNNIGSVIKADVQLQDHAFSALRTLSINADSHQAVLPFLSCNTLTNLRKLRADKIAVETEDAFRSLILLIPSFAPNLVEFVSSYNPVTEIDDTLISDFSDKPISLDTFRALLPCHKIERFELKLPHHLLIDDSDVEKIASAWPNLKRIGLCPSPLGPRRRTKKPTF